MSERRPFAVLAQEEMARRGITRSELARRLCVTLPRVTQILLRESTSERSMLAVAEALDAEVEIRLVPKTHHVTRTEEDDHEKT